MSVSFSITNMPELRKVLREYSKVSKKTDAQICNDKAKDLAFKAIATTEKANADEIAAELGQIGNQVRVRKDGRFAKGKQIFQDDSLAARIINARLRDKGEPMLFGKPMLDAVRKMINARRRAVAFIKSGWLAAARAMLTGKASGSAQGAQIRGKPKGRSVPAKPSVVPFAEIANSATKDSPRAAIQAQEGLARAVPIVIADTKAYIERKHQEAAKKAGVA